MGRRLLNILRAILSSGPEFLETPETRAQLEHQLLSEGFLKEEIVRAFEWFSTASAREDVFSKIKPLLHPDVIEQTVESTILDLSDAAFQFLSSLKELGLVDENMEEEILNRLMMAYSGRIGLAELKRVAAIVIFEHQFDSSDEYYGIFDEEWRLLFN